MNAVVQENAAELFVNPDTSTELLNDRPTLRLAAVVNHPNVMPPAAGSSEQALRGVEAGAPRKYGDVEHLRFSDLRFTIWAAVQLPNW